MHTNPTNLLLSIKKDFLDDREFLAKFGILEFEIELMLDYLYFEQIS